MSNTPTRLSLDPRARLGRRAGRRFLIEWVAIGCLGITVILFGSLGRMSASVDHLMYDRLLMWRAQPVLPDIVVLEIDNESIAQLGRWPWPRSVHASLLEQLAKARPAAVVYDVLFTEPARDDASFARAVALSPTYLPVLLTNDGRGGRHAVVEPVAPLAQAAAGLGHINLEVDSDGIVRSVAQYEGDAGARWPQLMVTVAGAARPGRLALNSGSTVSPAFTRQPNRSTVGEGRFLIPFSRNSQSYTKLSFASVLAGEVPVEKLRGRIVVVGVTASGLYDRFATPVSGELGPLPGVYIHANVLDTLLTGREVLPAARWLLSGVSLAPLAALLAGFLVLSPRRSLLLTGALCLLAMAASAILLYGARLWLSPVPAIIGVVVVYPIWNWRRLEMTMAYLRKELQRLANEPHLLPQTPQRRREFGGDVLEQHMALMAQAAQRVQDMKRFMWDSLNSVPEPILVSDVRGIVLIANHAAKAHFTRLGAPMPEGRAMQAVLGGLTLVKAIDSGAASDADNTLFARAHWPALLDPARSEFAGLMAQGVEVRDANQRDHLLRYANCTNAQGETTGWIAGLVDVSALHAAERQREDALRLLSHDMRSPQASILALVEMERARETSALARGLLERIERYAQRALTLADDFVQLARAESQTYMLEPVNLAEIVIDASDEVWPQAHAKRITLDSGTHSEGDVDDAAGGGYWICADRSLMTRALVNVLNNAVKYSPPDTRIACELSYVKPAPAAAGRVSCTIRDEGYGIPEEQQAGLFERFRRFHEIERPEVGGAGLGMAFIKTVVTRHGGEVTVTSAPGRGTAVTISLPLLDDEPSALPANLLDDARARK
ncbi:CHASE2 domain-containing protein [bacterium M00.F.Ca.ET.228.01.1.1]|uniref:CHASE2 domain-containing protein n=1 Tax=Paraburkholderia phenoliruptrix TaxID=252970 RepID=UPI0010931859|nr:CHASE2 domain-containing protein [Paraburkholderia phenoliruptrix]TGP39784.1 CHASE2 domain-containing protein [bacterium M00.F.Ca.ET.228.01.1.1]TGR95645.1 CHASE2 domain-containing protein [bacterium M00.F.Ca.ET.191.01.1.1]TGT96661.1 CHASE2 domain-containing protein [bacterium M00.F.Ca.ET.155.01.1.1]MBW0451034.1 CHASE2 domain-containing protein [Paraburkholderia phenoliruptrix]MBW9101961.1 CHASE2 domain-containing protein [Paraburkholderia phenoliruptrix]